MQTRIELPYGNGVRTLGIPPEWLGEIAVPRAITPAPDPVALIASSVRNPVGTRPLRELARPGDKVAIVVDDFTRKTPVPLMLPPVLHELEDAGIARQDICLVIALGTHRAMTHAEVVAKLGTDMADRYAVVNVPSTTTAEMVYSGASTLGIPAWVNRRVAEADVRIGLGMITPHLEAGFTGGAKIILPGVCGSETVDAFHSVSAFIPENQLGNVATPLRRNLEQFVAERVPLHFIVNVVLNLEGALYQCVAGHYIDAHRRGVRFAEEVYGVEVRRRYPVVVANSYPYDIDWWQSAKGAWAGDRMTADGGTLVIVTAAPEGNSNYPLVPYYTGCHAEELRRQIRAGTAADSKQASAGAMFGNLRRRIDLMLVSDGLSQADADAMRMPFFASVEDAVAAAVARLPESERQGSVAVLPQGGVLLPIVSQGV